MGVESSISPRCLDAAGESAKGDQGHRTAGNDTDIQFAVTQHHMKELHGAEKKVFETEGDFYCLIETGGSNSDHDEEVCLTLLFSITGYALRSTDQSVAAHASACLL